MILAECYEILKLSPGASIDDIDLAFGKQRTELIRQGRKSAKAQLTAAYHQLRDHTLNDQAAKPAAPDVYLPEHHIGEQLDRLLQPHKVRVTVKIVERERELQVQLHGRVGAVKPSIVVMVMKCLQKLDPAGIETVVISGVRGKGVIDWQQNFQIDENIKVADTDPYSFANRFVQRGALPIAFLIAIIAQLLVFPRFMLRGVQIWIHELGHATVAWLSGYRATPLPFGWTNVSEDKSPIVYGCFLILLLILFWSGWREKKRWAMFVAMALAVVQFYMTWLMPEYNYHLWLYFGGVGGEIYLSTLMIVGFYFPLPDKFRWDFWRYPVLLMATYTFAESFGMWHQIKTGTETIPWGTMLGGQGDAGGDMNNLRGFGWSDTQIINTYSYLGNVCLLMLMGVYGLFWLRSLQNRSWWQLRK